MGKTTDPPPPPAASQGDEDPIWGNMLDGFFGISQHAEPSSTRPADETRPAPKKPARKRPKAQ